MGDAQNITTTDLADKLSITQYGKTAIEGVQENLSNAQQVGIFGNRSTEISVHVRGNLGGGQLIVR